MPYRGLRGRTPISVVSTGSRAEAAMLQRSGGSANRVKGGWSSAEHGRFGRTGIGCGCWIETRLGCQAEKRASITAAFRGLPSVRAQKVTRKNVFAGAGGHFQRVRAQKVTRVRPSGPHTHVAWVTHGTLAPRTVYWGRRCVQRFCRHTHSIGHCILKQT